MYLSSEIDRLEWKAIKNTRYYFFNSLNSKAELKEISLSMLSLEWHYLSAFFSKLYEVVKNLFYVPIYLLGHDFTKASGAVYGVITAAITSLVNLTLLAFFTFINSLRVITLVMATCISSGSKLIRDFFYDDSYRVKLINSKKISLLLNEIKENVLNIYDEKADIIEKIRMIGEQIRHRVSLQKSKIIGVEQSCEETVNFSKQNSCNIAIELENLLKSYPLYDDNKRNDIDYLNEFNTQISEHHFQAVEVADLFFAENINYLCSSPKPL